MGDLFDPIVEDAMEDMRVWLDWCHLYDQTFVMMFEAIEEVNGQPKSELF